MPHAARHVRTHAPTLPRLVAAAFIMALMHAAHAGCNLKNDEHVLFIPALARVSASPHLLEMDIHAWVYEDEHRPGARTALARYLGIDRDHLPPQQAQHFEQRARLFLKDSERGKRLRVRLADGSIHTLPPTNASGRTTATVTPPRQIAGDNLVRFHLDCDGRPPQEGQAFYVSPHGLSVVSDIDDTIKDSSVTDKKQLLRNTFLHEFKPVPGMAALYQRLERRCAASATCGNATFHYLSSSPIQLLPPLTDFLHTQGFPPGSMHLRESTAWHSLLASADESKAHKHAHLQHLLTTFPQRRFILIGDSGEADPEIYAAFARSRPQQIQAILIRNVTGEDAPSPRWQQTFDGVDGRIWHIFQDAPDETFHLP